MRWVCLLRSELLATAHLAHQLLEGVGVPAQLRGLHRSGLGGMIPMDDSLLEVWVPQDQLSRAREALGLAAEPVADGRLSLAELETVAGRLSVSSAGELSEPTGEVGADAARETCPSCGAPWEPGFEVCWNCDAVLG